jgi:hypothetical protein
MAFLVWIIKWMTVVERLREKCSQHVQRTSFTKEKQLVLIHLNKHWKKTIITVKNYLHLSHLAH